MHTISVYQLSYNPSLCLCMWETERNSFCTQAGFELIIFLPQPLEWWDADVCHHNQHSTHCMYVCTFILGAGRACLHMLQRPDINFVCLCFFVFLKVCVCIVKVPVEVRKEYQASWTWGYRHLWDTQHGCWVRNSHRLQGWEVLLSPELSL